MMSLRYNNRSKFCTGATVEQGFSFVTVGADGGLNANAASPAIGKRDCWCGIDQELGSQVVLWSPLNFVSCPFKLSRILKDKASTSSSGSTQVNLYLYSRNTKMITTKYKEIF